VMVVRVAVIVPVVRMVVSRCRHTVSRNCQFGATLGRLLWPD
jgi:hypothetical protein